MCSTAGATRAARSPRTRPPPPAPPNQRTRRKATEMKRGFAATLLFALPVAGLLAGAGAYVQLPGGNFRTALKYEDIKGATRIAPFALMRKPVTNAEFLAFVEQHPQW